MCRLVYRFTIV